MPVIEQPVLAVSKRAAQLVPTHLLAFGNLLVNRIQFLSGDTYGAAIVVWLNNRRGGQFSRCCCGWSENERERSIGVI